MEKVTLIVILSFLFTVAVGYTALPYSQIHQHKVIDYYAYPEYKYEYAVHDPHTGDHKTAFENRDGDKVIGMYSFLEPDGRTRIVEYRSDDEHGFQAHVKFVGVAHHPNHYHHPHYQQYHNEYNNL